MAVFCTACRTNYRPASAGKAGRRGCPRCGHANWIAAAFVRDRVPATAQRPLA